MPNLPDNAQNQYESVNWPDQFKVSEKRWRVNRKTVWGLPFGVTLPMAFSRAFLPFGYDSARLGMRRFWNPVFEFETCAEIEIDRCRLLRTRHQHDLVAARHAAFDAASRSRLPKPRFLKSVRVTCQHPADLTDKNCTAAKGHELVEHFLCAVQHRTRIAWSKMLIQVQQSRQVISAGMSYM
ncbi:hypothetical protein [Mesorhizobium sp. M1B.F.Ca.ET.045.04.1.1]|uniref:hypothetical protein n=1 Tax=Mesorhizobium sp. M1B.F.Ca.ET.045.04.1.1 TaxID=2493673 RepID=UPI00167A5B16|nr:hypothetical protein [Mesorhizobium sp. M1B.F.Ca.ET.045.04.1.1]